MANNLQALDLRDVNGHVPVIATTESGGVHSLVANDANSGGILTAAGTIAANTGRIPAQVEGATPITNQGFASSAAMTRPNNTTAYTALDVIGTDPASNIEFTSVGASGGNVIITGVSLRIDVGPLPAGVSNYRLHLYDAAPTAITDNLAYNLPSGDRAKYLGFIEIPTVIDLGDTLWSRIDNVNFKCKLSGTSLFGMLQTVTGFTPSAETVKTIRISGYRV